MTLPPVDIQLSRLANCAEQGWLRSRYKLTKAGKPTQHTLETTLLQTVVCVDGGRRNHRMFRSTLLGVPVLVSTTTGTIYDEKSGRCMSSGLLWLDSKKGGQ